jgi:hypothetical protein
MLILKNPVILSYIYCGVGDATGFSDGGITAGLGVSGDECK